MVEAAEPRHALVERVLAGMAEGRVAEVVRQRQRLGQVLVEPEGAGQRPGDLAHLDGVGQPGAEMVALVIDEDLRLVLEPAEGGGMDDPVPVALELAAGRRDRPRGTAGLGSPRDRRRRGLAIVSPKGRTLVTRVEALSSAHLPCSEQLMQELRPHEDWKCP